MIVNCIIIDDEQPAREIIEGFVAKIHYLKLNGSFKNPLDAIAYMQQNQVDLIFLDVQMPDLTGIELLRCITYKPQVVFTTAYSEYALEGFELNATDYLLKPFAFDRFLTAINKVAERAKPRAPQQQTDSPKEYITIHADHKIFKIMLNDILYIEGLKEYVSYYTRDRQRIIALQSLKSLETACKHAEQVLHHSNVFFFFFWSLSLLKTSAARQKSGRLRLQTSETSRRM